MIYECKKCNKQLQWCGLYYSCPQCPKRVGVIENECQAQYIIEMKKHRRDLGDFDIVDTNAEFVEKYGGGMRKVEREGKGFESVIKRKGDE